MAKYYSFNKTKNKENIAVSEPVTSVTLEETENNEFDISTQNEELDTEFSADGVFEIDLQDYVMNTQVSTGGFRSARVYVATVNDPSNLSEIISKLGNVGVKKGDLLIATTDGLTSTTGYAYTTEYGWIAFSGNAGVENVVFTKDIICAGNYTQVGNITKTSNGTATISAKGKTVEEVITTIFTQELQPTKVEPSVNITFAQVGAKEVGTTISPTYSASLSPGSYTYGPATAVAAISWEISDSDGNSAISASGSFPSFVVEDSTNYMITAKCNHTKGVIAVSNIGSNSNPVVEISAGSKTRTSSAVTGYRAFFYGPLTTDSSTSITSSIVRGLKNGGNYNGSKSLVINPITGAKRYVIAIPQASKRSGLTSAILPNSLNAQVVSQYSIQTIQVEGLNGYTAVDYKVYVYEPASIGGNEIHNITLG